jgi:hypothetical protein
MTAVSSSPRPVTARKGKHNVKHVGSDVICVDRVTSKRSQLSTPRNHLTMSCDGPNDMISTESAGVDDQCSIIVPEIEDLSTFHANSEVSKRPSSGLVSNYNSPPRTPPLQPLSITTDILSPHHERSLIARSHLSDPSVDVASNVERCSGGRATSRLEALGMESEQSRQPVPYSSIDVAYWSMHEGHIAKPATDAMIPISSHASGFTRAKAVSAKFNDQGQRTGRWSLDEKLLFLYGLRHYGKGRWKKMKAYLPLR